jgi:hypothetical protein
MIQWLDAVFQLLRQFPKAFEFNAGLLSEIADALYSCEYGTFLANTEQEYAKFKDRTKLLWNELLSSKTYLNPRFDPLSADVLIPKYDVGDLSVFLQYFKRWDNSAQMLKFDENAVLDEICNQESRK